MLKAALVIGVGKETMYSPREPLFWKLFMPPLLLGVVLYLGKRRHWNPMVFFPLIVGVPIVVFYVVVAAAGLTVEDARGAGGRAIIV